MGVLVKKLPIRMGYEITNDALVVRGGRLHLLDIALALEKCRSVYGVLGFSVRAAEVPDVAALCRLDPPVPHPEICRTTVGQLRGVPGVNLLPTFAAPHYTVVLPDSDRMTVELVIDAFSPPERNPTRSRSTGGGSGGVR